MNPIPPARRRHKRRHLIYYLDVLEAGTDRLVGHVGDVTPEGLLLVDTDGLEAGRELDVEVLLPEVPGLAASLHGHAVVRWVGQDKNPSIDCAGCSFEPRSLEDRAALDLVVRLVGFDDAEV